jgi:hypothetical protein
VRHTAIAALIALSIAAAGQAQTSHDTTSPTLTAFAAAPQSLACSTAACGTQVTWSATDDMSGVAAIDITATSQYSTQSKTAHCDVSPPTVTVTAATCTVKLPQYAAAGAWQLQAMLTDAAGNAIVYTSTQLGTLGFSHNFTVQ